MVFFLAACDGSEKEIIKVVHSKPIEQAVQWTRDKCGNRQYAIKSSLTVDDLVRNALEKAQAGDIKIDQGLFFYVHLDYKSLVDLYSRLYALRSEGILINTLTFDIRDYMFRLSVADPGAATYFKEAVQVGSDAFQAFQPDHSEFHLLAQTMACPLNTLAEASIYVGAGPSNQAGSDKKLRVFHGALEAHNIRVGGVASFVSGLVQAENRHTDESGTRDIESSLVTPFYDLLKTKFLDTAEFVGFIDHEIDSQHVRSTVYKVIDQGTEQYLIQSDQGYRMGLYNLGEASNLYRYFADEIWLYYSNALASFAALYRGPNGDENIDVLQINDWHLAMTSAILAEELNPKRKAVGLPPIATVATTHEVNEFQGRQIGSYLFQRMGLKQPPTKNINVQALFQVFSNASNTVSRSVAKEMMSPDESLGYGLGSLFTELGRMNRFFGITNGIDVAAFDPTVNLGTLNVRSDYSDLYEQKIEAKRQLFEAGLIGDPAKPLFLYVGRFSKEKGVDTFPEFVRLVVEDYKGQVVIMGAKTDASVDGTISELEAMAKESRYRKNFRLYTNVKSDQLEKMRSVGAPKGLVIRFASDFTFVPSIQESCGLVPIEAMAMGSGVLTSNVHGLQDLCKPLDGPDVRGCMHDVESFTCATFKRTQNAKHTAINLDHGLREVFTKWNQMSAIDKRMAQIRWALEARTFAWDRKGGATDQYKDLYMRAIQSETMEEAQIRSRLMDVYVNYY